MVRPHGLRGQVVVELWTNLDQRVRPGSRLEGPAGPLTVEASSPAAPSGGHARWLVSFAEIADREQAERIRDCVLLAEPVEIEGALWVHELVGAEVVDAEGRPVGQVEAVEANPASDLLILADGRAVPLTFVTRGAGGVLRVDGPPGLLDP